LWYDGGFGFRDVTSGVYDLIVDGEFDLVAAGWDAGILSHTGLSVTVGHDVTVPDLIAGQESLTVVLAPTIEGARVVLLPAGGDDSLGTYLVGLTDQDGASTIENLTPGEYQLRVFADGMAPHEQNVTVPAAGAVEVTLTEGQIVQGTLTDPESNPAPGFVSLIERSSGRAFSAFSDADGYYTAESLPTGAFDVWISDGIHRPVFMENVVVDGPVAHTLNATLASTGAVITGHVTGAGGEPLLGVQVSVVDGAGTPVVSTLTDDASAYELGPLPAVTVTVRASCKWTAQSSPPPARPRLPSCLWVSTPGDACL